MNTGKIQFEKALPHHTEMIFKWLGEPHVKEFWDNSSEHRKDIQLFVNRSNKKRDYFGGIFTYWRGSINKEPYAFLMTSEILPDQDVPEMWKNHLSKIGKTFTIDFCIGNTNFLGKGLGLITLENFVKFFQTSVKGVCDAFFIDPDENNQRAIHVYEKAGFNPVGDFVMKNGYFKGRGSTLMIKKCQ